MYPIYPSVPVRSSRSQARSNFPHQSPSAMDTKTVGEASEGEMLTPPVKNRLDRCRSTEIVLLTAASRLV